MRHPFPLYLLLLLAGVARGDNLAQEASEHSDIDVTVSLDAAQQSGEAVGAVKIRAQRETIWALITSCKEALHILPGLVSCEVLETAPDRSWQRIRQVMNYSWYLPTVTYEMRAAYEAPSHVDLERLSGDLRTLRCSWLLERQGEYTTAHYHVTLAPGFWVPQWVVRAALRGDLPKMLRALKSRAEYVQGHPGAAALPAAP